MRKALLWIFLSLLSTESFTQHLPITLYSAQDGAPVIGANSVFQDKQGWLWFTDGYHVIRYDGYRFKKYYPQKKYRLEFTFQVLEIGKEIWALSYPYPFKVSGDSLVAIDTARRYPVMVQSLFFRNKQFILTNEGLNLFENDRIEPYIIDTSFKFGFSNSNLVSYNDSVLLAFDSTHRLVIFDIKNKLFCTLPNKVDMMRKDINGRIFFLENGKSILILKGLYRANENWVANTENYYSFRHSLPGDQDRPSSFEVDHAGNLWIAEQFRRLIRVSPNMQTISYTEEHGLPSLWFNQMLVDREGLLWIVYNSGICKIRQSNWERFTSREGLSSNHATFISEGEKEGELFIGTQNGVNIFQNGKVSALKKDGQIFHAICLEQVDGKILYVRENGFYQAYLDEKDHTVIKEKLIEKLSSPGSQMVKDKQNTVFMSIPRGIGVWYNGRLFNFPTKAKNFRKLLVDSHNNFWAGSFAEGLVQFSIEYHDSEISLKEVDYFEQIKGINLPLQSIRALAEDARGNIIVGTRYNGLFYLRMKNNRVDSVIQFTEDDGLTSNTIWGLGVNKNDEVWIGTAMGLNRGRWEGAQFKLTNVSKLNQIYTVSNIFLDRLNTIWVANHPGVTRLISDESLKTAPFSVFITRILMDGKTPSRNSNGSYNYKQNNFILEFSSNTFLDEKEVTYSYRLMSNENEQWTEPQSIHSVNYSSLKPGTYRFQVRAMNVDGRWSENNAEYAFQIKPPFWETPWFIALVILLIGAGLYALYRYRIAQLLRLQEVRNNISRNLHDDIGASLSNINILNELAKRNMRDESKADLYLSKAGEDIQRISESLSDIVWNINPRYDDLANLFIRMKRYAADMLEGKSISAELVFPTIEHPVTLPMDQRRDFYLIFKEAVNNLVKYSKATQALVEVKLNSHSINLLIRDNGKGFDSTKVHAETSGGNGLYNMKQRADKWKGGLTIESLPGKGTVVRVSMRI